MVLSFVYYLLTLFYSLRQLSDESFVAVEAIFSNKSSDQSAFRRLQCFNLQKLCSSHGIAVIATGIRGRKALKDDFVGATMKFVGSANDINTRGSHS